MHSVDNKKAAPSLSANPTVYTPRKRRQRPMPKPVVKRAVAPRIISAIMITAAIVCMTIAVLFVREHPSTLEGGAFYAFLPTRQDTAETEIFANLTLPPQDEPPEAQPPYTPQYQLLYEYPSAEYLAYEPLPYESDAYEPYTPAMELPPQAPEPPTPAIESINLPPPPPMPEPHPPTESHFSAFSFYIPENAYLYAYFQNRNPNMPAETVVWKVNAHLHLPFYYYIHVNNHPNPLLINPFYRLPPGFAPSTLVPVNNSDCTLRATPETVTAFRALRTSASKSGFNLSVVSAFRTAARQAQLFSARNYVDGVVARPYHSEHQTGRALDLWGPGSSGLLDAGRPSPTGRWVAANAHYYGFIIRYRADTTHITGFIHEPWHITYVTVEISMYMHENNILSLEEFVARRPEISLNRG